MEEKPHKETEGEGGELRNDGNIPNFCKKPWIWVSQVAKD